MTAILKKVGVLAALAMAISMSAGAQVNNSDFLISGISNSAWAHSPGDARGRGGRGGGGIAAGIAAGVMNSLNGGSINSPVTGNNVTGAAVTNLGLLMGGSPAGVASVTAALTGAGVPAGLAGSLVQALNGLGNTPSLAQVTAAARAFNAMVANSGTPNAALNSPEVLAINAALTAMLAGS